MEGLLPWVAFTCVIVLLLALDLGVFHRHAHAIAPREAALWSAFWIGLAVVFNIGVFAFQGRDTGVEFLTAYLIEKSLSVDNIFVFVLIFSYFAVPAMHQHRVLFWGVVGALIMRGALIATGASLLEHFHWVIYVFGGLLVVSGIRMGTQREEHIDPERNPVVRLVRRFVPTTSAYSGSRLIVRDGRWMLTPLAIVLIVVETTDLVFALDSIPAVFAVSDDPFIVYTSNVFAILGLRSLYFLLAGVVSRFVYLKIGLAAILVWVGGKMLLTDVFHVPTLASLGVVGGVLAVAFGASLLRERLAGVEAAAVEPVTGGGAP